MKEQAVSNVSVQAEQQFMVQLYEDYKYLMYTTAKKYVSDSIVIEDIIQNTLVRLIPKIPILREMKKSSLTAYVVYAVKNVSINYLRDKSIENQYIVFSLPDDLETKKYTEPRYIESTVLKEEKIQELWSILSNLPDKEQEILIRKYYLKQSDLLIGEKIKSKPSSVRMMLTRARRHALKLLKEEKFAYEAV